jgi:hypothetical protein
MLTIGVPGAVIVVLAALFARFELRAADRPVLLVRHNEKVAAA